MKVSDIFEDMQKKIDDAKAKLDVAKKRMDNLGKKKEADWDDTPRRQRRSNRRGTGGGVNIKAPGNM